VSASDLPDLLHFVNFGSVHLITIRSTMTGLEYPPEVATLPFQTKRSSHLNDPIDSDITSCPDERPP
jgi:hypothetical protein